LRHIYLPPQPIVDGQPRVDLPVVFAVEEPTILALASIQSSGILGVVVGAVEGGESADKKVA
jgi:hypothetical protein